MLRAALCVLPHSESEVYYVEANASGRQPSGTRRAEGVSPPVHLRFTFNLS